MKTFVISTFFETVGVHHPIFFSVWKKTSLVFTAKQVQVWSRLKLLFKNIIVQHINTWTFFQFLTLRKFSSELDTKHCIMLFSHFFVTLNIYLLFLILFWSFCVFSPISISSLYLLSACRCNVAGSLGPFCSELGGLCECKPNVIGRCCDTCAPLTFGFGPAGCKREKLSKPDSTKTWILLFKAVMLICSLLWCLQHVSVTLVVQCRSYAIRSEVSVRVVQM